MPVLFLVILLNLPRFVRKQVRVRAETANGEVTESAGSENERGKDHPESPPPIPELGDSA